MLSVDLISAETDLESVRSQFEANATLTEQQEMEELVTILFEENSIELTESEQEKVQSLQNAHDLFFYEESDPIEKLEKFREFIQARPEIGDDIETILSYILGRGATLEEAQEVKSEMQEEGVDLEFTLPSP